MSGIVILGPKPVESVKGNGGGVSSGGVINLGFVIVDVNEGRVDTDVFSRVSFGRSDVDVWKDCRGWNESCVTRLVRGEKEVRDMRIVGVLGLDVVMYKKLSVVG